MGHPFSLATALLFAALLDLDLADLPALRRRVTELTGLRGRVEAPPIRLTTDAMAGFLDVLDGAVQPGMARIDGALADPGSGTAPGLPAMLLRIRLAAAQAAGLTDESRGPLGGCWPTACGFGTPPRRRCSTPNAEVRRRGTLGERPPAHPARMTDTMQRHLLYELRGRFRGTLLRRVKRDTPRPAGSGTGRSTGSPR